MCVRIEMASKQGLQRKNCIYKDADGWRNDEQGEETEERCESLCGEIEVKANREIRVCNEITKKKR
jgi:hypothetical protein